MKKAGGSWLTVLGLVLFLGACAGDPSAPEPKPQYTDAGTPTCSQGYTWDPASGTCKGIILGN